MSGDRIGPSRRAVLAMAMVGAGASGCAATFRNHGYVPTDEDLATLRVGVDTRAEVAQAVGRPTSAGILSDGGWYYVRSRFRNFAYRAPQEIDREVLAVSFTDAGTLSNIERYGLEDGRVVVLSRRVTEANLQGVPFLRQLFRNIGNLDASELVN